MLCYVCYLLAVDSCSQILLEACTHSPFRQSDDKQSYSGYEGSHKHVITPGTWLAHHGVDCRCNSRYFGGEASRSVFLLSFFFPPLSVVPGQWSTFCCCFTVCLSSHNGFPGGKPVAAERLYPALLARHVPWRNSKLILPEVPAALDSSVNFGDGAIR